VPSFEPQPELQAEPELELQPHAETEAEAEPAAESGSEWRLLDAQALGDAPRDAARQLRDLAEDVKEREMERRHTFIGKPPREPQPSEPAAAASDSDAVADMHAAPDEPDFERFLRYVRSLKH
jgi:hypothetical protein